MGQHSRKPANMRHRFGRLGTAAALVAVSTATVGAGMATAAPSVGGGVLDGGTTSVNEVDEIADQVRLAHKYLQEASATAKSVDKGVEAVIAAAPAQQEVTGQAAATADQLLDGDVSGAVASAQEHFDDVAEGMYAGVSSLGEQVQEIPEQVVAPSFSGEAVLAAAKAKLGAPYVYGATGPDSFDCSGLTSWAYAQIGTMIPRTSGAQIAGGTPVSLNALRAGDIVSFYGGGHVGIADGQGNVVHAPTDGDVVKVTPIEYMGAENAVRY